eukprot:1022433-Alexandrium_andersonii.AAC.1
MQAFDFAMRHRKSPPPSATPQVLSHLRFRRIASPDCPAPLPHLPEAPGGAFGQGSIEQRIRVLFEARVG